MRLCQGMHGFLRVIPAMPALWDLLEVEREWECAWSRSPERTAPCMLAFGADAGVVRYAAALCEDQRGLAHPLRALPAAGGPLEQKPEGDCAILGG